MQAIAPTNYVSHHRVLLILFGLMLVTSFAPSAVQSATQTVKGFEAASNTSDRQVTALRRAIIGKESNGNFKAVNPDSGALGYGQVMPENVAPWTKEALGRSLTAEEFLNSPEAQIKVIDHKLSGYLKGALRKTGGDEAIAVRRVASAWYSGQGDWFDNTAPQTYGTGQYPSIASYTQDVLRRYNEEKVAIAGNK